MVGTVVVGGAVMWECVSNLESNVAAMVRAAVMGTVVVVYCGEIYEN